MLDVVANMAARQQSALSALVILCAAHIALAPRFPPSSSVRVLTALASGVMTLSTLPFVEDYATRGSVAQACRCAQTQQQPVIGSSECAAPSSLMIIIYADIIRRRTSART